MRPVHQPKNRHARARRRALLRADVPGIPRPFVARKSVDGRDKPGHDDFVQARYTDLRTMLARRPSPRSLTDLVCRHARARRRRFASRRATHQSSSRRRRGPITTGSSFTLRPPTQQPSCPGLSRASTSLLVARKAWMAGTSPAMTISFKRRESRHSRVVPHAGLPRHSPLATHHSSSPCRRGPITTGSSLRRCPRTASLNTSDTAYGSLRSQERRRCSCRRSIHYSPSPSRSGHSPKSSIC